MLQTTLHGAPYGMGGEIGEGLESVDVALDYAKRALSPGQSMIVWRGDGRDETDMVARYVCSAEFGTTEAHI